MSEQVTDEVKSLLEDSYENLSNLEKLQKAKDTSDKIKGKKFEEVLNINNDSIQIAYEMISNDNAPTEVRKLLLGLIENIVTLTNFSQELYNYNEMSFDLDISDDAQHHDDMSDGGYAEVIQTVQDHLTQNFATELRASRVDKNIKEKMRTHIRNFVVQKSIILPEAGSAEETARIIQRAILDYDILTKYMVQPANTPFHEFVEEIRVDDFNDIRIVRGGKEEYIKEAFTSPQHALIFAQKLVREATSAVPFDIKNPFARLRVGPTTRVSLMRDPIATRGVDMNMPLTDPVVHMVIRRQRTDPFSPEQLIELNSINEYGDTLLKTFLGNGISMCFYGGTGTGKTAMFNAYATALSEKDRVFTMAEVDEMKARRIDNRKTILNDDGVEIPNPRYRKAINSALMWEDSTLNTVITAGGLRGFMGMLNAALTMTPSVLVIQESKGSEVSTLVEASISDHQVVTTIHCAEPEDLPSRMVMMYQESGTKMSEHSINRQVISAFPIIVGCSRFMDGKRRIARITEFIKYKQNTGEFVTRTLLMYNVTGNRLDEKGNLVVDGKYLNIDMPTTKIIQKMKHKGLLDEDLRNLQELFDKTKTAERPAGIDTVTEDDDNYAG